METVADFILGGSKITAQMLLRRCRWVLPTCLSLGFPVHRQLPELTQTHVHSVGDAIPPSHPLLSPFPPALNLSQPQYIENWKNTEKGQ